MLPELKRHRKECGAHGVHWIRINCDDLGMHPTLNEAIADILERRIITSCSLMPTAAYFQDAVRRLRSLGIDKVGTHLALTMEYPSNPLRPVSDPRRVSTLVTPDGTLPSDIRLVRRNSSESHIEFELRQQIERVRGEFEVSHLDCHMFFNEEDEGGTCIRNIVRRLSREFRLPLRDRKQPELQGLRGHRFIWEGYETLTERFRFYEEYLKSPSCAGEELILHPGKDLRAMIHFTAAGKRRLADYLFFKGRRFERLVHKGNIRVTGWADWKAPA